MFERLFSVFGARIWNRADSQRSDTAGQRAVEYGSDGDAYGTEQALMLPSGFEQSQGIGPDDASSPQASLPSNLSPNGLRGGLRLIRPRTYNPQCIVVVVADYLPRGDGSYFLPKSIYTVNKVEARFAKYGPILYTIGREAIRFRSREYYIVFESAMSAASVYAETEEGGIPAGCSRLRIRSSAAIPHSFGDWVARFCHTETKLPDECAHLSCTHPIRKDSNLFLRKATCTPNIVPVPCSTHHSRHKPHEQPIFPQQIASPTFMGGLPLQHSAYPPDVEDAGTPGSHPVPWQTLAPSPPTFQPLDSHVTPSAVSTPAHSSIPLASPPNAIPSSASYDSPSASPPLPHGPASELNIAPGHSLLPHWQEVHSNEVALGNTLGTSSNSHNPLKRVLDDESEDPQTTLAKRFKY